MDSRYHSFLVRLWTSENNEDPTWLILLESSKTGEKQCFTNLKDLLDFFKNLMGLPSVLRRDAQGEPTQ